MAESVYNLIPAAQPPVVKQSRHKSKFNASAPPSCSTFGFHGTSKVMSNVAGETQDSGIGGHPGKKSTGTFGRTVVETVNPKTFLKKSQRADPAYEAPAFRREGEKKPGVPTREEKPVLGLQTDKNFVVANAVENILAVPKKKAAEPPRAVDKATFGKVPGYIQRTKAELREHYALVDKYGAEKAAKDKDRFRQLSIDEVAELREGLQRRWEQLNKQFQTMGFNLETKTQIKHRESIEKELKQVEQAIVKVNKPNLFLYDDKI